MRVSMNRFVACLVSVLTVNGLLHGAEQTQHQSLGVKEPVAVGLLLAATEKVPYSKMSPKSQKCERNKRPWDFMKWGEDYYSEIRWKTRSESEDSSSSVDAGER